MMRWALYYSATTAGFLMHNFVIAIETFGRQIKKMFSTYILAMVVLIPISFNIFVQLYICILLHHEQTLATKMMRWVLYHCATTSGFFEQKIVIFIETFGR